VASDAALLARHSSPPPSAPRAGDYAEFRSPSANVVAPRMSVVPETPGETPAPGNMSVVPETPGAIPETPASARGGASSSAVSHLDTLVNGPEL
jgi:hypothetical protein